MSDRPYISLILPAYNEAKRIVGTINEAEVYFKARNLTYQIVVSADGDDGTDSLVEDIARSNPAVKFIGSKTRGGKGLGIRRAIPLCDGQCIGFADADNKTPIDEFDKIDSFLRKGVPIVIGSRVRDSALIERPQPLYRQWGSKVFAFAMHAMCGLPHITDTQCGFKFFQREAIIEIFSLQKVNGYMYDVEILLLAQNLGYAIEQVPVRWRDDGDSRLNLVRGTIDNFSELARIRRSARQSVRTRLPSQDMTSRRSDR